jgi:PAS domain S-box-containing protein
MHESLLRVSIDHLLEGVQVIGFDWTYLYLNDTAARHGRRSADALIGRTMMECYTGIEHTALFATMQRVMRTRRAERMLNEFAYDDGDSRWFELRIEPVPDGVCVLSLDITERHMAELQLQQAQKMEAIGHLAGGIAHDFNNMLTAILGYAELMSEQIGPDKPIGRDLQEIVFAAERAAALTRQLLAFSRKQHVNPRPMSLNDIVKGIEPMLRRLLGENIAIRTALDPATRSVLADPIQIEQVVLNLAVNARDAMPTGGILRIDTGNVSIDDAAARDRGDLPAGEYARLTVTDTGVGMTPDVRARIFEPFFTTKDRGHGTGLGLAAVHGIVKQLGGTIDVESEPAHGTTFTIYLPWTELPIAPVGRTGRVASVGTDRILLVEDEPAVRSFARMVLTRHGYQVAEVPSAEDALAWAASGAGYDLLLTDVMLTGVDGVQLADQLRDRRPDLRVLFMSGYAEPAGMPTGASVLEKPFTAHALLTAVRAALEHEQ